MCRSGRRASLFAGGGLALAGLYDTLVCWFKEGNKDNRRICASGPESWWSFCWVGCSGGVCAAAPPLGPALSGRPGEQPAPDFIMPTLKPYRAEEGDRLTLSRLVGPSPSRSTSGPVGAPPAAVKRRCSRQPGAGTRTGCCSWESTSLRLLEGGQPSRVTPSSAGCPRRAC